MDQLISNSMTAGVVLSLIGYGMGIMLKKKFNYALFSPLLISIVFVISFLLIFKVDFDSYNKSAQYITYFLTPTTVCLAIPLYRKIHLVKEYKGAILGSVAAGVLASLGSILLMSMAFGLSHEHYTTLLPKSITTAVALGVLEEIGGNEAIMLTSIMITGVLGNVIAESVCKFFRIKHPIARGLAIGTASHAGGTAKAMEMGEVEGAMSSLSIVIAGVLTVIGANIFALFY